MLRIAAVRLGLLVLPACTAMPTTSGIEQGIVGGETATSAEYPTVVGLEEGPGNWFCTGTLIDKDWILTAAHCVEDVKAADVNIRFDSNNLNVANTGHRVAAAAIYANPGYNGIAWDNDIALIKLATSVTDRAPTPIHRAMTTTATEVIQVGYGATSDDDQVAGALRQLTTSTIDCAVTGDSSIVAKNVVCFDQRDGNGTCYGDSGGPSFVNVDGHLEVAAITSGGTVESCLDGFDIQTAVGGELDFIDATMSGNPPTDPEDPNAGTDPNDPDAQGDEEAGGCNAGGTRGASGGLLLLGLAALFARRRR